MKVLKVPFTKVTLKEIREVPKIERKSFKAKYRADELTKLGFDMTRHIELR